MKRRIPVVIALSATLLGSALAPAATAAPSAAPSPPVNIAALPTCNDWRKLSYIVNGNIRYRWTPIRRVGTVSYSLKCKLVQGRTLNDGHKRAVLALQRMLRVCYNQDQVRADGKFGPITRAGLVNAQRWAKVAERQRVLVVDGKYGPQTREHVRWPMYNRQGRFMFCKRLGR